MKRFYVTFGGHLFDYYMVFEAKDENIVRAYMNRRSKLNCWCSVQDNVPKYGQQLNAKVVDLHYEAAEHV